MLDSYYRDKPLEIVFTRQIVLDDLIVEDVWRLKKGFTSSAKMVKKSNYL